MITLQTLFDALATGELVNTKLSTDGHINPSEYPTLVSHLNLGLIELYKRFTLKRNEVKLMQHVDVTKYYLRSEHLGDDGSLDEYAYLIYDEDTPFEDDLVKVLEVYNGSNELIPLNDSTNSASILTPELDILIIPATDNPELLSVIYQSLYPTIIYKDADSFDPTKIQLNIPATIIEALLCYMTSRVFNGMTSSVTEGTTTPGMTYDAKYEIACKKIDLYGLDVQHNDSQQRFKRNGWC